MLYNLLFDIKRCHLEIWVINWTSTFFSGAIVMFLWYGCIWKAGWLIAFAAEALLVLGQPRLNREPARLIMDKENTTEN